MVPKWEWHFWLFASLVCGIINFSLCETLRNSFPPRSERSYTLPTYPTLPPVSYIPPSATIVGQAAAAPLTSVSTNKETTTDTTVAAAPPPSYYMDISNLLAGNSKYSQFLELLKSNNVDTEIKSSGNGLTVFAPSNDAISKLSSYANSTITSTSSYSYVLRYNILIKYYTYNDLKALGSTQLNSKAGPLLTVIGSSSAVKIGDGDPQAQVTDPDVIANEHLSVQGIDYLLIPSQIVPTASQTVPSSTVPPSPSAASPARAPAVLISPPPPSTPVRAPSSSPPVASPTSLGSPVGDPPTGLGSLVSTPSTSLGSPGLPSASGSPGAPTATPASIPSSASVTHVTLLKASAMVRGTAAVVSGPIIVAAAVLLW